MQQVWRFNGGSAVRDAAGNPVLSAGGYGYGLACARPVASSASPSPIPVGSRASLADAMAPEQGVGIVAMGNLTYTGWGSVIDRAYDVLAATGGPEPRQPQPARSSRACAIASRLVTLMMRSPIAWPP
jgi:hypothetical protein